MTESGSLSQLESHHVGCIPSTVYYVPDFITDLEEEYLLKQVYEAPKPKWTELSNRRLQNWGGIPHEKGMIPEAIPKWLSDICDRVGHLEMFAGHKPNHVLVNEYLPGQGIMPHTDGPLYYPVVANITLKSHGVLDLYHTISGDDATSLEQRHFGSILLERRSLLLVMDDLYSNYLHGIAEKMSDALTDKIVNLKACPQRTLGDICDRGTRVSLTIRNIPKVLKTKFLFGGKKK